jgi:arylsulfatase A-like enzyme
MGRSFEGVISVDVRDLVPDWAPYLQPLAPQGAPNVVYIVLDDVGFSAMEPWGGLIETPNINRLAGNGLTYTNWHTTALCPADEMNMASTKRNWPVGRGFERYYGFLDGYHLTTDLTDKAIEFITDAKVITPDKPFFMYFCPGATHAPHHVPKEWIERYRGRFDMGYERYREQVFERQKRLGILPDSAELSPLNPYAEERSADGKPWNPVDVVRPWDSLSEEERRLFCRMAEVYAGFLSHTDQEIGRLFDFLEESGELDNTIVVLVSDNGASGEGGPNGSVNENKFFNGIPDDIAENLSYLEELGSPTTYNHYPVGWAWAFNTPFKMWKRYNFEGGVADPLIVSWPRGIEARGELRHQFAQAMPTTGTLSLFINDEKVGEGRILTQPGNFSLVGEGLNVGKDPGEPVTADYPGTSPFAFTGGRIVKAIVDVSGEPFIDLEKEAVAMMARE